jgi:putative PIG3 family NAD(P)H quinone oxidoreductase
MRAVVLEEYGGADVLKIRDVPDPVPGPEEVVVEIAATALNRADLVQRLGLYPGPPMPHEIPGLEFSGRVRELGDRVASWSVGDAVMGIVGGGAYAERIAVHERQVLPVPSTVDLVDAAAIPEVWITAYDALVLQGGLTTGRVALVHAGASGVGTAAIQLCKAIAAQVIVTTSAAKVLACEQLGADLVVDYKATDYVEAVREFTQGRGVDTVLDVVGGDYVDRNIDCLVTGGRIVQVGVMAGGAPANIAKLMSKRGVIIGTLLRPRPLEEKIAVTQRFGREVLPLFDRGVARPVIDRSFPFEEIAGAHEHMHANANVGKVVVVVAPSAASR